MRLSFAVFLLSWSLCANDQLSYRVQNCEIELEMLRNSISTQEQARISVEREVSKLLKETKTALSKGQNSTSIAKIVSDLKTIKNHENDLSDRVNTLSQNISKIKNNQQQNTNAIKELEQALRAITVALNGKTTSTYTVKNGDSLDKIARSHKMSVKQLMKLNNLDKNTIIHPDQELLTEYHE